MAGWRATRPARNFIEEQDREIGEKSGMRPLAIKDLWRAGEKPKQRSQAKRKEHGAEA